MSEEKISMRNDDRERTTHVSDSTLRNFLEQKMFDKEYTDGYYIRTIVKDGDGWTVIWHKDICK